MKEFIEKLIGRLEEKSVEITFPLYPDDSTSFVPITEAISIVNQLAEEYKPCHKPCTDCEEYDLVRNHCPKLCKVIKETVKEIEENHSKWIPCSERLPEEPFGCLVTVMDCEPMTQTDFENILPYHVGYDGETWNDTDGNVIPFEVIAWQPLPTAYRTEGEHG